MIKHFRQLAFESLVYGLAGIASRFLSVFLVPVYTRLFSPEDFGVMSLVTVTMTVINIFVVLALDNSASRWYFDTDDTGERKSTLASWAWCQIAVSLVFGLFVFAFADPLARVIVHREDAGQYFRLSAGTLPLGALGFVVVNWLRMERRPWTTTFFALGNSLATILMIIFFVIILHKGILGVFLAQLIAAGFATIVAAFLLGDWIGPRYFNVKRLREMLRFGVPLIPAAIAFWVVGFADRYFVQFYTNTSEVGLYQVGGSLAATVALITSAFQQAWGPFALSIHKQANARDVYASVLTIFTWLTSLVGVTLALFAPELIRIFATERYIGAASVVGLLAFSYIMMGLYNIASIGPSIVKTTAPVGMAVTIAAVADIGLNLILTPHWGKVGSGVSTLIAQALVPAYLFYRSHQLYAIPYRFGPVSGMLVFSFLIIAAGTFVTFGELWIGVVYKLALIALFVPLLFVCGILNVERARKVLHFSFIRSR